MEVHGILIGKAKDEDIVSTFGEKPKKFIRELHRLTTYVKRTEKRILFLKSIINNP
jgi:hypothetical protein